MKEIFNINNPIWVFMGKVFNIILLSILWVLFSIPVITLGPASAALSYVTLKMVREEESGIIRSFWHAFRENFKQGILMTLMAIAATVVLYYDFLFSFAVAGTFGQMLRILFVLLAINLMMSLCYTLPLQAWFQNTIKNTIKNAWILSINHLATTVPLLLLHAIPVALLLLFPSAFLRTLPVWLFLAPGCIAYFDAICLRKLFDSLSVPSNLC